MTNFKGRGKTASYYYTLTELDELKYYMNYINLVTALDRYRYYYCLSRGSGKVDLNMRTYNESVFNLSTKDKIRTVENEYRKFINKNKYGRITIRWEQISIPRIQCSPCNGNNIKYDSRRLFDDMGK